MRIVFFSAQVIRKLAYIFVDQAARHRLLTILAIGMFMLCLPGTVWADGILTLVQDLTPQPYQAGFSHPWHSAIASANGLLFFVAQDEVNGIELWKSDGAITNTRLIKDIYPGAPSSNPQQFTVINETLFFAADDGSTGLELWKTDGTFTGTVQVKDILPGPQGSSPKHLINVAGTLFFIVDSGSDSSELWKSDGTEAGTILVKAGFPRFLLPHLLNLSNFTAANGRLFFAAEDGNSGKELWTSDGTTSGTKLVKDIYPGPISSFPDNLTNINGMIFFITHSSTSALWKSDGTAAGTQLVQEFGRDYIDDLTVVNKTLLFICYAHNENVSLWKSDGTTNGTVLIQEFGQSYLVALTNVNDILFFFLIDSREPTLLKNGLWKSDGTTSGTVNLRAFDNRAPYSTINSNGVLFFSVDSVLWKSDGTITGTLPIFSGGIAEQLTNGNDALFFTVCDNTTCGLWKKNNNGAIPLKLGIPAQGSSALKQFGIKNGELFFVKDNGPNNQELWKSNGTVAGSEYIKTFSNISWSASAPFVSMKQALFFIADDDGNGQRLWRSDGTKEGTTVITQSVLPGLTQVNDTLFFGGPHGLWKSDGTTAGTTLVKEITCSDPSCAVQISDITAARGGAFFRVEIEPFCCHNSRAYFSDLWKTDSTTQGTVLVKHFGEAFSGLAVDNTPNTLVELTYVNGILFFVGRETGNVNTLWRSDGTPEGTISLTRPGVTPDEAPAELTNVAGTLFFRMNDGVNGVELWKSDGTVTGTLLVKDIRPGPFGAMPTELTAVGERLFFSANDGRSGRELWQSDGTSEGTRLVKDIWPGSSSAVPQQLSNVNGNLVFSASDGQSGVEAWRSDGTAAGTIRIYDIALGPANANPTQFIFAGDQMFFTANDGAAGQELWSLRSFITKVATTGGELFSWLDHTTYEFPNGTFTTPVTVTHSLRTPIQSADSYPLLPLGYAFKLTVVDSTTALPVQAERPYRLTVQYTDAELGVVIESTLALYGWDGQQWVKEPSSIVESATHRIIATPTHTAQWVVLGNTYRLLLPVITK